MTARALADCLQHFACYDAGHSTLNIPLPDDLHDLLIEDLSSDSNRCTPNSIFFALQGNRQHGAVHISDAIKHGCRAIALDEHADLAEIEKGLIEKGSSATALFQFKNATEELPAFLKWYFGDISQTVRVVGITGTNGKTSVLCYLASFYQRLGQSVGVIGTLGYGMWNDTQSFKHSGMTSLGLIDCYRIMHQLQMAGVSTIIMEVSSHAIQQNRIAGINFDAKILTQVSQDHLDYHSSLAEYQAVKRQFFTDTNQHTKSDILHEMVHIINSADAQGRLILQEISHQSTPIIVKTYGVEIGDANLSASNTELNQAGITTHLSMDLCDGRKADLRLDLPLFGAYVVENLMAAWLCFIQLEDVQFEDLSIYGKQLPAVNGRLERMLEKPALFIDFAHTQDAISRSLHSMRQHFSDAEIWIVFGAGGDRDASKRPMMGAAAAALADRIFICNDNPRNEQPADIAADIIAGIPVASDTELSAERVAIILDRRLAITTALNQSIERLEAMPTLSNIVILVAGKGHENYQIIGDKTLKYSDFEVVQSWSSQHFEDATAH